MENKLTEIIQDIKQQTADIKQGGSLSLALFNLIVDKLISNIRIMKGHKTWNFNFNILCYANDNLQTILHRITAPAVEKN